MGSTLSVVKETQCPLNIALKQATPLYYENKVMPGQTIKRNVGKVWFTLEAKLWNGENDYETRRDIVAPITVISVAPFFPLVAAAGGATAYALTRKEGRVGNVFLPNGASNEAITKIYRWVNDYAVKEYGIYMGRDRTIRIRGGPSSQFVDGKLHILSEEEFHLFYDEVGVNPPNPEEIGSGDFCGDGGLDQQNKMLTDNPTKDSQ